MNNIINFIKRNKLNILLIILILYIMQQKIEGFDISEKNILSFKDVALNEEMQKNGSLIDDCQHYQEQLEITKRKLKACQDYKYYYFPYAKYNMPYEPSDGSNILTTAPQDLEWKGYNRHEIVGDKIDIVT